MSYDWRRLLFWVLDTCEYWLPWLEWWWDCLGSGGVEPQPTKVSVCIIVLVSDMFPAGVMRCGCTGVRGAELHKAKCGYPMILCHDSLACSSDLHFLMTSDVEHICICLFYLYMLIFISCLEKSIQILPPFLNWIVILLLNCMGSLYILYTSPLSVIWFSNIFPHSVSCLLFYFLDMLFKHKCFKKILVNSNFSFFLCPLWFWIDMKKPLHNSKS